ACVTTFTSQVVTIPGSPNILSVDNFDITDCGLTDGIVTITATNTAGVSSLEYSINNGTTYTTLNGGNFTGLVNATYTPVVRLIGYPLCTTGGAAYDQVVTIPSIPNLISVDNFDISNCGLTDGIVTITASNTTSPLVSSLEYSLDGGASYISNGGNYTGLTNNTYNPAVRLVGYPRCTVSGIAQVITVPSVPTVASYAHYRISDCGVTDGILVMNAANTTSPLVSQLEYSINSGVAYPQTNGTFAGLSAGNYTGIVRLQGFTACTVTAFNNFVITAPGIPTITGLTSVNETDCFRNDGVITLTSINPNSLPVQYRIDAGAWLNTTAGIYTGLSPATYTVSVRVTSSPNCVTTSSAISILRPQTPTNILIQKTDESACEQEDGTISLTGVGGVAPLQYRITGSPWQPTNTFTGVPPGTYVTEVRNASSPTCSFSGATLNILSAPGLVMGAFTSDRNEVCSSDGINISLSGWRGTSIVVSASIPGNAFANITNSFSNTTSTGFILANSSVMFNPGTDVIFNVTVLGGTCTPIVTSLGITTYKPSDAGNIEYYSAYNGNVLSVCGNFALTLSTTGVNRAPRYDWEVIKSGSASPISLNNDSSIYVDNYPTVSGIYNVTVTNGVCAPALATPVSIYVQPKPTLTGINIYFPNNGICSDDNNSGLSTSIELKGLNVKNNVTVTSTMFNISKIDDLIWNVNATSITTTASVIVEAKLLNNPLCPAVLPLFDTVNVEKRISNAPAVGSLKYGKDIYCNYTTTSPLNWKFAQGAFSGFLQSNNNIKLPINTLTGMIDLAAINTLGSYTIKYKVNDIGICKYDSLITNVTVIGVSSGTVSSLAANTGLCFGQSANVDVTGYMGKPAWYMLEKGKSWQFVDSSSVTYTTSALKDTTQYKVIVSSGVCPGYTKESNIVSIPVSPEAIGGNILNSNPDVCENTEFTLTLTGYKGTNIKWSYIIIEKDAYAKDTTENSSDWTNYQQAVNNATFSTTYIGDYGSKIIFRAFVYNNIACGTKTSTHTTVNRCDQNGFVPNVISPNTQSDKNNSYWNLTKLRLEDYAEIYIFNRYGIEVFYASGAKYRKEPWTADNLPAATYYYVIQFNDGIQKPKTGYVTVIK
ncbi:MAG: gliding motility-associated C-terminal domain-containing protein, partial [Cytophagales bacterium]|nr:gliding motility-associated C-terminal domain-containing protein [Cytophagales bacterium]